MAEKKSYFSIEECCCSNSYPSLVTVPKPGTSIYENLEYTISKMNVIREKWGGPIIISSGFRNPTLNRRVGGSSTSFHLLGLAVDCHPKTGSIMKLAQTVIESGVEFDQLILEYVTKKNGEITDCKWLHIGFGRQSNRHQILAYDGQHYRPVKITKEVKFTL